MMTIEENLIVREFGKLFYGSLNDTNKLYQRTTWMGVDCLKCPLDLWIYQEILHEVRPDLIIETGTYRGGSALYLAHLCDCLGQGHVVTIDILGQPCPRHERITYLHGSSTDENIIKAALAAGGGNPKTVLVILDSDHSQQHVLAELRAYSKLVTDNSYLIVEDTNINGHPVWPSFGPGPYEAVNAFLSESEGFVLDRSREKFLLTFNPKGYLKKVGRASFPSTSSDPTLDDDNQVIDLADVIGLLHKKELATAYEHIKKQDESLLAIGKEQSLLLQELQQQGADLSRHMANLADCEANLANCEANLANCEANLAHYQNAYTHAQAEINRIMSYWPIALMLKIRRAIYAIFKPR